MTAAWRRPYAESRELRRGDQVLWVAYAPIRAFKDRLIPRGSYSYSSPPASRREAARAWLLEHL